MVTDGKHTERIAIWLTERELADLACMADAQDRKISEMARYAVRVFMYGTLKQEHCGDQSANSPRTPGVDTDR
jgi:hypothetical protein